MITNRDKRDAIFDKESLNRMGPPSTNNVLAKIMQKDGLDVNHGTPLTEVFAHENKSTLASNTSASDSKYNIVSVGDASSKLAEMSINDNSFSGLQTSSSPEAISNFNKFIVGKSKRDGDRKTGAFAYCHTQTLLSQYKIRRIENDIYLYQPEFGRFKLINDNELKTLIRKGFDDEIQCRLSKFEVADIVERIQTDPSIIVPADFFDSNEYYVNFLNGTLDLLSNEFHSHSPDFCLTTLLLANYDPNYEMEGSIFSSFISDITEEDTKKIDHYQEYMGYNFSSISRIKKATVTIGERDSGKSTNNRVVQQILGAENVSNFSLAALNNRFTLGKLLTKKINIFGERGAAVLKDIETFKSITGGDWNESENKGKDFVNRPSKTKLIFSGNSLPMFENSDDAEAFMERITLFIFSHTIKAEKRIPEMDQQLSKERDLIVSWAMDGLRRLIRNKFVFTEADDAIALRRSKKSQVSSTIDFIREHCTLQNDARVFSKDLYHKYLDYCTMNSFKPLEQTIFTSEVISKTEQKGPIHKKIRIGKDGPYFGFVNLGLKENYNHNGTSGTAEQNKKD